MAITRRAFENLDVLVLISEMLYLIDLMRDPVILKGSHKQDCLLHGCASGNRERNREPGIVRDMCSHQMTMLKMDFVPQQAPRSIISGQEQDSCSKTLHYTSAQNLGTEHPIHTYLVDLIRQ